MRKMLAGMVLALLGAGFATWGWVLLSDARTTLTWPAVPGTIIESAVEEHESASGEDVQYSVRFLYRYEVDGTLHEAERFSLADHSTDRREQMQAIADRFPRGSVAPVYYDPEAPAASLLRPGPTPVMWLPFVFGIIASYAGIAAVLTCLRRQRRSAGHAAPGAG